MEKTNCPAAAENKKGHAEFLLMFEQFYTQWQTSKMDLILAKSTYKKMSDWIVYHILAVDVKMRSKVSKPEED